MTFLPGEDSGCTQFIAPTPARCHRQGVEGVGFSPTDRGVEGVGSSLLDRGLEGVGSSLLDRGVEGVGSSLSRQRGGGCRV